MKTKDITLIAILVAILVVSQLAFSMVMGINLVFPLLIIFTYNFGYKKTMLTMLVFDIVSFMIYGYIFTRVLWLWTFAILIIGAYIISKVSKNEYVAAGYTAVYFMLFGLLSAVQEWLLTDVTILAYWSGSIYSDTLGAIAGFITTLVLLKPLSIVIQQFYYSKTKSLT